MEKMQKRSNITAGSKTNVDILVPAGNSYSLSVLAYASGIPPQDIGL